MQAIQIAMLFVSAVIFSSVAPPSIPSPPGQQTSSAAVYHALVGHWVGALEYRDYRSDKRVMLPTVLDVTAAPDAQSLTFQYVYDDGPGKIVKDRETVRIALGLHEYTVQDDDGSKTLYQIVKLDGFVETSSGTLSLSGPGIENGQKVEIRTNIRCGANSLTILRESRLPGEEFKFRHEYSFERALAPPSSLQPQP